ncbi:MAG: restriction endonuclease subunit S [Candidatus Marinimicrobia bacterium]|nr:restriction endonuclease subunit S [Candidatus Neomarinimicrobiota bacterium]
MGEWKESKLGEYVDSISETYKFKPYEQVVFLNTSDILLGRVINHELQDSAGLPGQAKKKIKNGDFLFSEIRPANGRYAMIDFNAENYVVSTKLMVLRCNDKIDRNFFKIFLTSKERLEYLQMIAEDRSGTFPQITFDHIYNLDISLPPLFEQKAIVSVLSSLDDKIDLLQRQNKTLEAMAETLFRQWFVEKAQEDWEEGTLGDLIELVYGKGLKRSERAGVGYPVVGSSGIVGFHSNYLVQGPGIVIGRKGTLGKTIYIEDNFYPIDTTYYVKSRINSNSLFFEYFLLKNINFEEMNTDSAVPGLNRNIALSVELTIPPTELIKKFSEFTKQVFEKRSNNKSQIRILEKLRDTLLPKLMSGEVRVAY